MPFLGQTHLVYEGLVRVIPGKGCLQGRGLRGGADFPVNALEQGGQQFFPLQTWDNNGITTYKSQATNQDNYTCKLKSVWRAGCFVIARGRPGDGAQS
jgi:hypothetical protein